MELDELVEIKRSDSYPRWLDRVHAQAQAAQVMREQEVELVRPRPSFFRVFFSRRIMPIFRELLAPPERKISNPMQSFDSVTDDRLVRCLDV